MKYKINFDFLFTVESVSPAGRYKKAEENDLLMCSEEGPVREDKFPQYEVSGEEYHSSDIQF